MDRAAPVSAPAPAAPSASGEAFYGARWAVAFAAALLGALALLTGARWLGGGASPGSGGDEIRQIPVPADAASDAPAKDRTAPDPGDTP